MCVFWKRVSNYKSILSYFCSVIYLGDRIMSKHTELLYTTCCTVFYNMEMPLCICLCKCLICNCPIDGNLYCFKPSFPFLPLEMMTTLRHIFMSMCEYFLKGNNWGVELLYSQTVFTLKFLTDTAKLAEHPKGLTILYSWQLHVKITFFILC